VCGPEVGRGRQDHLVHVGQGTQLLRGIEPGEAMVILDEDGIGEVFEVLSAGGESVGEYVGQGHDFDSFAGGGGALLHVFGMIAGLRVDDVGGRSEDVEHGAGAASAASDHSHADRIIRCGVGGKDERKVGCRGDAGEGDGGLFEEVATALGVFGGGAWEWMHGRSIGVALGKGDVEVSRPLAPCRSRKSRVSLRGVSESVRQVVRFGRWFTSLALGFSLILWAGCRPGGNAAEESNQNIQTGLDYQAAKLYPQAEKAFLRALQNHPNSAEAHKRLGLLYFQDMKDYVGALYHLDRYSKLRADDKAYKHVTDACMQEIATQVPLGDITSRLRREATDVARKNQQLQEENTRLQRRIDELTLQREPLGQRTTRPYESDATVRSQAVTRAEGVVPQLRDITLPGTGTRGTTSAPPGRAVSTRRTHRIQPGDTIYSVGRRYNLEPSAILRANPTIDPRNLQIGQVIQLPNP